MLTPILVMQLRIHNRVMIKYLKSTIEIKNVIFAAMPNSLTIKPIEYLVAGDAASSALKISVAANIKILAIHIDNNSYEITPNTFFSILTVTFNHFADNFVLYQDRRCIYLYGAQ